MGKTNSAEAAPGTIRGDFGLSFSNNLVHGSDGPESSATELALFFSEEGDLIDWTPAHEQTAGSSGLVFHAERLWFGERYYRVKQLTGDR